MGGVEKRAIRRAPERRARMPARHGADLSEQKADELLAFNRRKKQRRRANQAARAAETASSGCPAPPPTSPPSPPSSPSPPPAEDEQEEEQAAPAFGGLQRLLAAVKEEAVEEAAASSSSCMAMPVGEAKAIKEELLEVKVELETADEAALAALRQICEGLASQK